MERQLSGHVLVVRRLAKTNVTFGAALHGIVIVTSLVGAKKSVLDSHEIDSWQQLIYNWENPNLTYALSYTQRIS